MSAGAENDRGQRKRKQKRRGAIRSMATLPVRSPHTMHSLVLTSLPRSLLAAHHLFHRPCISRASYLSPILSAKGIHPRENSATLICDSNVLREPLRVERPKLRFFLSSSNNRNQFVKYPCICVNTSNSIIKSFRFFYFSSDK